MFLGSLSTAERIHDYDYNYSISLAIVITCVFILTVLVIATAAAAAAMIMVYGCCNQFCITGTVMTAFVTIDNLTVTITIVSLLLF